MSGTDKRGYSHKHFYMGARVSISFKHKDEESVTLFHHWGGEDFPKLVDAFLSEMSDLAEEQRKKTPSFSDPFSRMEPAYMMVRFIAWLGKNDLYSDSMYLGKTENDGDNSDYGHHAFDLSTPPRKTFKE